MNFDLLIIHVIKIKEARNKTKQRLSAWLGLATGKVKANR